MTSRHLALRIPEKCGEPLAGRPRMRYFGISPMKRFCCMLAVLLPLTVFATQPIVIFTIQDLGTLGHALLPGVYSFLSSAQLTGTLTLDDLGDPNAQFVFHQLFGRERDLADGGMHGQLERRCRRLVLSHG